MRSIFLRIVQYILYRNSIHGAVCICALLGEKMCTHVLLTMCSSVIYVWTTPVEHQGMAPGLWGQPLACLHACSRESHAQLGFHRLINFSINFWFLNVCSGVIQERRKLLIALCSVLDIWQSECGEVCGHFCLQKTKNSNDCTVEKLKHKTVSIWFKNSLLCGAMWNSGYSRQGTPNPSINWGKGEREYVTFRRFVQLENNIVNVTQLVIPYMVI